MDENFIIVAFLTLSGTNLSQMFSVYIFLCKVRYLKL